jgi:hypothetical protein
MRGKSPPSIKCTASEQGTFEAIGSESMERAKENGMETDPPSFGNRTMYRLDTNMLTQTHTQIHNIKFVQINLHHSKAASAN